MKKPPWGRLSIVPANVTLWIPYPVRPVWAVVREIHQVFVSFKRPQNNTVWPGVLIYVRVIIVLAHNPPMAPSRKQARRVHLGAVGRGVGICRARKTSPAPHLCVGRQKHVAMHRRIASADFHAASINRQPWFALADSMFLHACAK